ncbi:MAG: hypothetical protein Q8Q63_09755 [Phaeovulum sp.]|uniref:head-tail connector protein n=1 Tax=Phaeovulum sp. TaxID=2934796 RepID=UPI0027367C0F|nr:hypothetical protein [Phaeovulum sp.]MDP3861851.1 hypothetical protein [Phaeovulum sp.]
MTLIEQAAVPAEALPVAEFRDHLRLGTGFADLGAGDTALVAYLRAAIAAIETRTAKALLARDFLLTIEDWRSTQGQPLPIAPVSAIAAVLLRDAAGNALVVDPARYRLVRDMSRPRVQAVGGSLPLVPMEGAVEISFTAGFGPGWDSLPVDLAQAVFLLAAQYYELRHEGIAEVQAIPFGVMALIEPWRTVRVLGARA